MRPPTGMTRILTLLAGLALVAGCAGDSGAATETVQAECGPVEEQPDGGHQHLVGDAEPPVDYLTVPPTSGWHFREADRIREALAVHGPDDPLSEVEQASVLSVDAVVITYHDLPDAERQALEEIAAEYEGRIAVTAYDRLEPGQVALAAWRTLQVCDGVDAETITTFVEEHAKEDQDLQMRGDH